MKSLKDTWCMADYKSNLSMAHPYGEMAGCYAQQQAVMKYYEALHWGITTPMLGQASGEAINRKLLLLEDIT